jgi:hypothetical protein
MTFVDFLVRIMYLSMVLQPFLDLGRFFSFLIFYTVGRTPWMAISSSQGRYLNTGQQKHRINAHRHHASSWIRTHDPSV